MISDSALLKDLEGISPVTDADDVGKEPDAKVKLLGEIKREISSLILSRGVVRKKSNLTSESYRESSS